MEAALCLEHAKTQQRHVGVRPIHQCDPGQHLAAREQLEQGLTLPSRDQDLVGRRQFGATGGKVGELISSHIIARPHEDLLKAFVTNAAGGWRGETFWEDTSDLLLAPGQPVPTPPEGLVVGAALGEAVAACS